MTLVFFEHEARHMPIALLVAAAILSAPIVPDFPESGVATSDVVQILNDVFDAPLTVMLTVDTTRRLEEAAPKKTLPGLSQMRFKLAQAICPNRATPAEKALLACKAFELARKIKGAKDEVDKQRFGEERKALYAEAAAMSDADKTVAAAAHKDLYARAFSGFCGGAAVTAASEMCTNEMMRRMYGGFKPIGQRMATMTKQ